PVRRHQQPPPPALPRPRRRPGTGRPPPPRHPRPIQEHPGMTTIELPVPTVHCRSCQLNIEEQLEEVARVRASALDLVAKRLTVDYDAALVDVATIADAIEAAGYPVSSPTG